MPVTGTANLRNNQAYVFAAGAGPNGETTVAIPQVTIVDEAGDPAGTGLTDTQLRATPVPVSGPVTDTQLRASPVPISLGDLGAGEYETVAASQTTQALGATGAVGDYLSHLLIIPATAAAGAVSIKDGSNTAVQVFAGGGTTALPTLAPIPVALGVRSASGAWQVTTGASVSVVAIGNFT